MFDRMLDDHGRLRAVIADLRSRFSADQMPTDRCFASLRWMLTRELLCHLVVENEVLRREGIPPQPTDILEFRYRQHLAEWQTPKIAADWAYYRRDLAKILNALERRMDDEEREIYGPPVALVGPPALISITPTLSRPSPMAVPGTTW